jgi:hypothetical protein
MAPETPEFPASAVLTFTAPLVFAVLTPELKEMLPPVFPVPSPPSNTTNPPTPFVLEPPINSALPPDELEPVDSPAEI